MKIENQVVSLELAKELKENGHKQEGLWYWYEHKQRGKDDDFSECLALDNEPDYTMHPREHWNKYVAPTVAELGEKLLDYSGNIGYNAKHKKWSAHYVGNVKELSATEADARAKMWLYLKKEGLICK